MILFLAYTPLLDPLPIWSNNWMWAVFFFPLCLAIAITYKAVKCQDTRRIPVESAQLFLTIVLLMGAAAIALYSVVRFVQ